jgi:hypothetical protein
MKIHMPLLLSGNMVFYALGAVAQLGERLVRNEEASGSIPLSSTTLRPAGFGWQATKWTDARNRIFNLPKL